MIDDASLQNVFLFKNLDKRETKLVRSLLKQQSLQPKKKVVVEGKPGESLFIIISGKVRVSREFDKEAFSLAELGPYDFFGEMSLIDDFHTSATVETLTETTVLNMTRKTLRN
jgi:CRP-like cAMP-binding protein